MVRTVAYVIYKSVNFQLWLPRCIILEESEGRTSPKGHCLQTINILRTQITGSSIFTFNIQYVLDVII